MTRLQSTAGTIVTPCEKAARRFIGFFTANIRNPNTPRTYARAVGHFFSWCERRGLEPIFLRHVS